MSIEGKITLDDFIGQQRIKEALKINIAASKIHKETLGHILLTGPRGCGKSTLINAIANEIDAPIRFTSLDVIRNISDFVAILTSLEPNSIIVIENLDTIQKDFVEILCTALESFCVDIVIGKGLGARSVRLELPPFTLIGVMDIKRKLPSKLLDCFSLSTIFSDYSKNELVKLSEKWCNFFEITITKDASERIASYAEGSNKKLTKTLKRARDFATVINNGLISLDVADKTIDSFSYNDFINDKIQE